MCFPYLQHEIIAKTKYSILILPLLDNILTIISYSTASIGSAGTGSRAVPPKSMINLYFVSESCFYTFCNLMFLLIDVNLK